MSEDVKKVKNYALKELDLVRVQATTDIENSACQKLLAKCGMDLEGVHRQAYRLKTGEFVDSKYYSIIKADLE